MDLKTLSRVYQAISREIFLDKLLIRVLKILLENTDAQLGLLLLKLAGEWVIEAEMTVDEGCQDVLRSLPITHRLPKLIIDHVACSQTTVVLNQANGKSNFSQDPYLQTQQPQSILCAPLSDRGKLEGIVYLENNCPTKVFTTKHQKNLQLLSEQIAIAIANARLYQQLSAKQTRVSQFLEALPVGVEVLDEQEKLYYTNQRAKELRTKGIVVEAAPPPTAKVQSNQDESEKYAENQLNLVESWSNSVVDEQGEVLYTINAFQDITEHKKAEQLLAEYNRTLEIQVAERTLELSQAMENLKTAQTKLIQSEKMVALGQLVAGVAHEINTPLGVIRASSYNNVKALAEFLEQMPQLFQRLSPQQQDLFFVFLARSLQNNSQVSSREKRKLKRELLSQLQAKAIEKARHIADILTDIGIYQEIDPFLALFKSPDVDLILQLAYNLARLQGNSNNIIISVERASKVVFALKNYARYDPTGEKQRVDITEGIETVLELYYNQLKQGVEVIREYQSLPLVFCYPDELIQVWTNLIHNAIQAMKGKGELEICAQEQENQVIVRITDSGCGIPESIKDKIFQPFFTTKPMGEGSGLGLDIARKIIAKHQGHIEVKSVPGCTTFQVSLPLKM